MVSNKEAREFQPKRADDARSDRVPLGRVHFVCNGVCVCVYVCAIGS